MELYQQMYYILFHGISDALQALDEVRIEDMLSSYSGLPSRKQRSAIWKGNEKRGRSADCGTASFL